MKKYLKEVLLLSDYDRTSSYTHRVIGIGTVMEGDAIMPFTK